MTKKALAKSMGISRSTLHRREREGKVRAIPTGGGQTRIPRKEQMKLREFGIPND